MIIYFINFHNPLEFENFYFENIYGYIKIHNFKHEKNNIKISNTEIC